MTNNKKCAIINIENKERGKIMKYEVRLNGIGDSKARVVKQRVRKKLLHKLRKCLEYLLNSPVTICAEN